MELKDIINQKLKSKESQEKYLVILSSRIEENRKTQGKLLFVMVIAVIAFPLLLEAKISEISIGPIKFIDSSIAISLIPTIFAFTYYQYHSILFNLVKQKNTYEIITSNIFNLNSKSILIKTLKHFSFTDLVNIHQDEKSKSLGCLAGIFWMPPAIIIMFLPFIFEFYAIKKMYDKFGLDNFWKWLFFIVPIIIGILTIFLIIQIIKKDLEELKG